MYVCVHALLLQEGRSPWVSVIVTWVGIVCLSLLLQGPWNIILFTVLCHRCSFVIVNEPSQKTNSHCSNHTKAISIQYRAALNLPKNNTSCHLHYHLRHLISLRDKNLSEPRVSDPKKFLELLSDVWTFAVKIILLCRLFQDRDVNRVDNVVYINLAGINSV